FPSSDRPSGPRSFRVSLSAASIAASAASHIAGGFLGAMSRAPTEARLDNFAYGLTAHDCVDVVSPTLQRLALLGGEVVPLVDADDASERAGLVIQALLNHRQPDAEPRHTACARPPQIVKDPWPRRLHMPVDRRLDAADARGGENVVRGVRKYRHA